MFVDEGLWSGRTAGRRRDDRLLIGHGGFVLYAIALSKRWTRNARSPDLDTSKTCHPESARSLAAAGRMQKLGQQGRELTNAPLNGLSAFALEREAVIRCGERRFRDAPKNGLRP